MHGNLADLICSDPDGFRERSGRRTGPLKLRPFRFVGLAVFCLLAFAGSAFPLDIPPYAGPVTDKAGVLNRRSAQELNEKILEYRRQSGIEIGVLIIESLDGAPLEDYAHDVFARWGIGAKDRDNGALLLVAIQDRKARIEVGYGLEAALTDLECGRIVSRNSPMADAFRAGDYAGGVSAAIDGMIAGIAGDYEAPSPEGSGGVPFGMMIFFMFIMISIVMSRIRKRARVGGPGGWSHGPFGGVGLGSGSSRGGSGGGFSFGGGSSGGGGASGGW